MPGGQMDAVVQHLRRAATLSATTRLADAELLNRYVSFRDEDAFTMLVRRYGRLVRSVCHHVLHHEEDIDDAFQSTFLVFAVKAGTIRKTTSVASWLYGVAYRTAMNAKRKALACRCDDLKTPTRCTSDQPAAEAALREIQAILDAEVQRLPEKLRGPFVLCCLEGKSRAEAARQTGLKEGTVSSRLAQARRQLQTRLVRRGVALSAALCAAEVSRTAATAAVAPTLVNSTVTAALAYAAGSSTAINLVSAEVAGLAKTVLHGMAATKLKVAVSVFLTVGLVAGGSGLLAHGLMMGRHQAVKTQKADTGDDKPHSDSASASGKTRPIKDAIGDPLPEASVLRLGTQRFRHPNSAAGLALSPDGKTVVTLGWEGLFAWDTATGQERWHAGRNELQRNLNPAVGASRLVFTPDGKSCITLYKDSSFKNWDVETGKATATAVTIEGEVPPRFLGSVVVSPDGKTLALSAPEGVLLCDCAGKVRARIANTPARPNDPNKDRLLAWEVSSYGRFASDGNSLAIVTSGADVVKICKAADGAELHRLQLGNRCLDSAFSPDGKLLAVAERDDAVRVYEIATGTCLRSWPLTLRGVNENYIFDVLFSPDGKTVVASASDKLIRIWDVTSGAEVGQLKGHIWYPWGLAFTADGKVLYSTGWDGDIRRWDLATRQQLPLPAGIRGSRVVAAAPDGRSVAYVDGDHNVRLVETKTGQELRKLNGPDMVTSQIAFAPTARILALGGTSRDQVVTCLLDVSFGKVIHRWQWPKGKDPHATVEELAFTPDGRWLAAMTFRQGQARVWDLHDTGKPPLVLAHPEGYSLSFAPDGKTLVTAGWDKKLRFWDPASGILQKEFQLMPPKNIAGAPDNLEDTRLWAVTYSPDRSRIAAADLNNLLWLWDAHSMRAIFVVHTGDIFRYNCLAFSPDGLWLATGGASGQVKVWDAATGQLVWDRGAHRGNVFKVSFSRDSRRLLSGAGDGLGYLWDLRPKELPTKKPAELSNDLLGADGPAAYRAFWTLLEQPDTAVSLLRERGNQLLAKIPPEQIEKWIAELDDDKFANRETAAARLSQHLLAAAPFMQKALANTRSLEQQRRLQRLLDRADQPRARVKLIVSVLAHLDTPAARKLLSEWAKADPDGVLGRAAAVASR